MKKPVFYLIIVLLLSVCPNTAMASEKNPMAMEKPATEIPKEIKNMIDRLNEIKDMDMSDLTSSEKRELRREVRDIKKTIKRSGTRGIFISTGAIIIILLVLLII
jgi:hypothetical protein